MPTISAADAKQRLEALLDAAQREPVLIRRQSRCSRDHVRRFRRTVSWATSPQVPSADPDREPPDFDLLRAVSCLGIGM